MKKLSGNLLLLAAAFIWGIAFVAQSAGMDYIEPFTFQACRWLLGAGALLPLALYRAKRAGGRQTTPALWRERAANLLKGGALCGTVLFIAGGLQQMSLVSVSAGKAGFLTALYILIVPVFSLFLGKKVRPALWVCIFTAFVGLYLLSIKEDLTITVHDLYLIGCAFVFALHILLVDHFSPKVDGVSLSCLQFLVAGLLSGIMMLLTETPQLRNILRAWAPLLYVGILSSGVAYTLQIIGQKRTTPAIASLIMSLESVFALLAGVVLLGEAPTAREIAGSALMFAAILAAQLVQLPPKPGIGTGRKTSGHA